MCASAQQVLHLLHVRNLAQMGIMLPAVFLRLESARGPVDSSFEQLPSGVRPNPRRRCNPVRTLRFQPLPGRHRGQIILLYWLSLSPCAL